ncbi:hypothetical protein [Gordonibacter sp.]|uniref:hypothetical protein n=1 Tax=Gordonibacter sp. TaxID=1968902 RepID=UPI002FC90F53
MSTLLKLWTRAPRTLMWVGGGKEQGAWGSCAFGWCMVVKPRYSLAWASVARGMESCALIVVNHILDKLWCSLSKRYFSGIANTLRRSDIPW